MLKNQKAFTLIELMVTITVLGLVAGMAIPGFNKMIANNRSVTLGEDFASMINFGRSASLKHGKRISLCASSDGLTCSGVWTDGYMVFEDGAASDTVAPPVVGNVLKVSGKPDSQAVISVKSGAAVLTFLRFTGLGTLARVNPDPLEIKVSVQKCTSTSARLIRVGLSGMVSIERTGC